MPTELIIQLAIAAAEVVTKAVLAIKADVTLTGAERDAAVARVRAKLQDIDAQVQAAVL